MKVGNLVKVRTKQYGEKTGVVVSVDAGTPRYPVWRIRPFDHPRDIHADPWNVVVISASR